MLTLAEEITLLLLDDEDGSLLPVQPWTLKCVHSGAILIDLALRNRVDCDLDRLFVVNPAPTGETILDPTLEKLAAGPQDEGSKHWVQAIANDGDDIAAAVLDRLIGRGILEQHDERILWVLRSRRYPMIDGRAEKEVKRRIMDVLFSDEIPEPRDIAIICLADACALFDELLGDRELENARARIDMVRRLDLIGQAMARAIEEIRTAVALAGQPAF